MKYTDIMLDFETLADTPNAAILSMAAVAFNLESGEISNHVFYENIDLQSCIKNGMEITGNTFYWWLTKSEDARKAIVNNEQKRHIGSIPSYFRAWLATVRQELGEKDLRIWGNGAKFDLGIIDNIFRKNNCTNPFDFRKERCVRTYASLRPEIMANIKFEGIKHHPVDDCRNQIRYVCHIHADINKNEVLSPIKKDRVLFIDNDEALIAYMKSCIQPISKKNVVDKALPEICSLGQIAYTHQGTFCGTSQGWVKIHEIIN